MMSRSVKAKSIPSGANFLANIADMAGTGHMLRLNVVL